VTYCVKLKRGAIWVLALHNKDAVATGAETVTCVAKLALNGAATGDAAPVALPFTAVP
jgi:hypothetical protein